MDVFAKEAAAFLNSYDSLALDQRDSFADLPDKPIVCRMIDQASWLHDQRNNVFVDHTFPQMLIIDLAGNWLRFCADPTNPARWEALFDLRYSIEGMKGLFDD